MSELTGWYLLIPYFLLFLFKEINLFYTFTSGDMITKKKKNNTEIVTNLFLLGISV